MKPVIKLFAVLLPLPLLQQAEAQTEEQINVVSEQMLKESGKNKTHETK